MESMGSGTLKGDDIVFWQLFLKWSQGVHARVNHAVTESSELSVSEFEVMTRLWSQPNHELLQQDLTTDLGWSPSRGSHLFRRLEQRGFIEREDLGYGRARTIRLTSLGHDHLATAFEVHGRAFRDCLLDQITPYQREVLQEIMANFASDQPQSRNG